MADFVREFTQGLFSFQALVVGALGYALHFVQTLINRLIQRFRGLSEVKNDIISRLNGFSTFESQLISIEKNYKQYDLKRLRKIRDLCHAIVNDSNIFAPSIYERIDVRKNFVSLSAKKMNAINDFYQKQSVRKSLLIKSIEQTIKKIQNGDDSFFDPKKLSSGVDSPDIKKLWEEQTEEFTKILFSEVKVELRDVIKDVAILGKKLGLSDVQRHSSRAKKLLHSLIV